MACWQIFADNICDLCTPIFALLLMFLVHCSRDHVMRHLGIKPFTCTTCKKCFTSVSDLRRHERTIHERCIIFQCHLCDRVFNDRSNYYSHGRKIHHQDFHGLVPDTRHKRHMLSGEQQDPLELLVADVQSILKKECSGKHNDPAVCPLCNKLFTKRTNLFTHSKKQHQVNFSHLIKGHYSQYKYMKDIMKHVPAFVKKRRRKMPDATCREDDNDTE